MRTLALALLLPLAAVAEDPIPPPAQPAIHFEVREIEVNGLEWRKILVDRADRLAWQDGSTVWRIDEPLLKDLLDHMQQDARTNVVQSPKLRTYAGQPGTITSQIQRHVVSDLKRIADGPPMEATAVAFQPQVDTIHDGTELTLCARPVENGLAVDIDLMERRVEEILVAQFEDGVKGDPESGTKPARIQASYQVPRVVKAQVEGQWNVQPGQHLLVSLGPRVQETRKAFKTQEVVKEKLVVITAKPHAPIVPITVPAPVANE